MAGSPSTCSTVLPLPVLGCEGSPLGLAREELVLEDEAAVAAGDLAHLGVGDELAAAALGAAALLHQLPSLQPLRTKRHATPPTPKRKGKTSLDAHIG